MFLADSSFYLDAVTVVVAILSLFLVVPAVTVRMAQTEINVCSDTSTY
jgi:hypothetical protein